MKPDQPYPVFPSADAEPARPERRLLATPDTEDLPFTVYWHMFGDRRMQSRSFATREEARAGAKAQRNQGDFVYGVFPGKSRPMIPRWKPPPKIRRKKVRDDGAR